MNNIPPNNPYPPYNGGYPPYEYVRTAQQDKEHLTMLAIAYYVFAGMNFLGTCGMMLYVWMLSMMGRVMDQVGRHSAPPASSIVQMAAAMGFAFFLGGAVLAALIAYAGRCLQLRKNAILIMVAAAINCLHFPLGTVLGVLTFVVLSRSSVKATFDQPANPYPPMGGPGGTY